ncbi:hypothetical protein ES705_09381 [subsurface metagenome]
MNLRKLKLIVWHKIHKENYQILEINWQTGTMDLISWNPRTNEHAPDDISSARIENVILLDIKVE